MPKSNKSRPQKQPLSPSSGPNSYSGSLFRAHEVLKNKPFAMTLIVFLTLLAVYLCLPASFYETNDDALMHMLLSGNFAIDKPNEYTLNLNVLLSKTLVFLYTYLPSIEWYPIMQVSSIFLAICYINYILFLTKGAAAFLLQLVTTLSTAIPFLIYIQFTKTAFALGFLSVLGLLLISQKTEKAANATSRFQWVLLCSLGFLGIATSYCIRTHSLYLVLIVLGFWALEVFLKGAIYTKVYFVSAFILLLSLHFWNKTLYDDSWVKSTRITGEIVLPMIDYNQIDFQENADVFTKAGLSANDVVVMANWGAVDPNVYSIEKLDYLNSHLKKRKTQLVNIKPALADAMSAPALSYLTCIAFLVSVIVVSFRIPIQRTLLLALLMLLFGTFWLAFTGRLPPRVSCPIIFSIPWLLLAFYERPRFSSKTNGYIIAVALLLSLPLVIFQIRDLGKLLDFRKAQNAEIHRLSDAVKAPTVLISWGAAFPLEGVKPFESFRYLANMRHIFFASHNQTPLQRKQFDLNKFDDVFISMLERDNVYLAVSPVLLGVIRQYYLEHYNKEIGVAISYNTDHVKLFKLLDHSQSK